MEKGTKEFDGESVEEKRKTIKDMIEKTRKGKEQQ